MHKSFIISLSVLITLCILGNHADESDEFILVNPEFFACDDESKSIPWVKKCDGVVDCDDRSDEWNCSE